MSNEAAIGLYADVLKYEKNSVATAYYADGEDAFDMILYLDRSIRDKVRAQKKKDHVKIRSPESEDEEEKPGEKTLTQQESEKLEASTVASTAVGDADDVGESAGKKKNKKKKKKKGKGGDQADTGEQEESKNDKPKAEE